MEGGGWRRGWCERKRALAQSGRGRWRFERSDFFFSAAASFHPFAGSPFLASTIFAAFDNKLSSSNGQAFDPSGCQVLAAGVGAQVTVEARRYVNPVSNR